MLGIDHAGLESIYKAGDHTAFNLKLHSGARYPLKTLALVAAAAGLAALAAMRLARNQSRPARAARDATSPDSRPQPALSA